MRVGMLWFDNSPGELAAKVDRAAAYYERKHGARPNACFVNPADLPGSELVTGGVIVKPSRSIQPGHFWMGFETQEVIT